MKEKIAILLGTRRRGAYSKKVAEHIAELAGELFDVTLVDPSTEEFRIEDDHAASDRYKEVVAEAAAFILVYPEYNHSYPGTLKSLLDSAHEEYLLKPFLLVGVSDGVFGGVRAIEAILPVIKVLGGYPLQKDIYVTEVDQKVDQLGRIIDRDILDTVDKRLNQLETYINKFNQIR